MFCHLHEVRMILPPDSIVGKVQVRLEFPATGQEWSVRPVSEQTSCDEDMTAAKFALSEASLGPSCQVSSSSSHHSVVSRAVVPFVPPIARIRGKVVPTGIIWKKALAL